MGFNRAFRRLLTGEYKAHPRSRPGAQERYEEVADSLYADRAATAAAAQQRPDFNSAQVAGLNNGFAAEYEEARAMKELDLAYKQALMEGEYRLRRGEIGLEHQNTRELDILGYDWQRKQAAFDSDLTKQRDARLSTQRIKESSSIADHAATIAEEEDRRQWEHDLEVEARERKDADRLRRIQRGDAVEERFDDLLFDQAEQAQLDIRDRKRYLPPETQKNLDKLHAKLGGLPTDPTVDEQDRPFVRADIHREIARIYANAPVIPLEKRDQTQDERFKQSTYKLGEGVFYDLEKRSLIDIREKEGGALAGGKKLGGGSYKDLADLRKREREFALKLRGMTTYNDETGKDVRDYSDEEIARKVYEEFQEERDALGVDLPDPEATVPKWDKQSINPGGNLKQAAEGQPMPQIVAPAGAIPPAPADADPNEVPMASPGDDPFNATPVLNPNIQKFWGKVNAEEAARIAAEDLVKAGQHPIRTFHGAGQKPQGFGENVDPLEITTDTRPMSVKQGEARLKAWRDQLPKYSTDAEVEAALASGKLKAGDSFIGPDGKRYEVQ